MGGATRFVMVLPVQPECKKELNMNKMLLIAVTLLIMVCGTAQARDDRLHFSIEEAMNTPDAKAKLNKGYTFLFGDTKSAEVVENFGEFQANKKTNAFGKEDKTACQWAFLSAMVSFQDRIAAEGGNAVINIRSYYKKNDFSSETEFECGAGGLMAGVTFKGDVVKLKE